MFGAHRRGRRPSFEPRVYRVCNDKGMARDFYNTRVCSSSNHISEIRFSKDMGYLMSQASGIWRPSASQHRLLTCGTTTNSYSFGREGYFEILLAGLHQFTLEKGVVSDDNIYCRLLIEGVSAGFLDPQLSGLMDDRRQVKRKVANKFEDMVNIISGSADRVPPIKLVRDDVSGPLRFTTLGGEVVRCSEIDGHHRFFSSQLMGLKQIHCTIT